MHWRAFAWRCWCDTCIWCGELLTPSGAPVGPVVVTVGAAGVLASLAVLGVAAAHSLLMLNAFEPLASLVGRACVLARASTRLKGMSQVQCAHKGVPQCPHCALSFSSRHDSRAVSQVWTPEKQHCSLQPAQASPPHLRVCWPSSPQMAGVNGVFSANTIHASHLRCTDAGRQPRIEWLGLQAKILPLQSALRL